ncbi:hypothetical protein [Sphingomonas sp. GC_Shp_6]|nr:hypothetical protein [Sphingomonas sp. GC_Shp_6]
MTAGFLRWPLAFPPDDAGARQAIGECSVDGAFEMVSVSDAAEAIVYSPEAPLTPLAGAMHYSMELVSDSGPAVERAGIVMLVAFDVPPSLTGEVDRWYEEEHIGLLMRADGWLRARRFRVVSCAGGPRWTSLAFHELRDISVMASPERAVARSTAWRAELERGAWFRAAGRGVFRPLTVQLSGSRIVDDPPVQL